jgi:beta-glucanase (GH16 family)
MPSTQASEIIFFDDFSSDELDRSRWNVQITGEVFNNEQQAYVDSPETLYTRKLREASGETVDALVIQPRYHPGYVTPQGQTFDFISGRIHTEGKVDFVYGNVAARMKLPAGAGIWPAFWSMGSHKPWPDNGEIDIMENIGDPAWTGMAMHGPGYSGDTPLVSRKHFPNGHDATAWHVYAVDWAPDALSFLLDGEMVYRVTRAMVEAHGPWVFDNPKHLLLNCALGGIFPASVNQVQSPYYGLPESTVRLIQGNIVRVLVDWVRVIRFAS